MSDIPKTAEQLLREYADTKVFTRETFSKVRTLMRNAADHIAELEKLAVVPPKAYQVPHVWIASNKTSAGVFATEKAAQDYRSSFAASVGGGIEISCVPVLGAHEPPKAQPDILGTRMLWSMTCACECEGCKAVDDLLMALSQRGPETTTANKEESK